jgi:hypothetical protein
MFRGILSERGHPIDDVAKVNQKFTLSARVIDFICIYTRFVSPARARECVLSQVRPSRERRLPFRGRSGRRGQEAAAWKGP